jgi:eukaryotic-like serine/threonine-protein kinase
VAPREIDAVLAAAGGAGDLDTGFGLRRLAQVGLVRLDGGRVTFRHPMVRDAVEGQAPASLRRAVHEAAFRVLDPTDRSSRARRARHAAAAGAAREAAALHLELADEARERSRFVEAEQHYTAALELDAEDRLRALAGRSKVRYGTGKLRRALEDVAAASEIADEAMLVELLLETATIHDALGDWTRAAEIVEPLGDRVAKLDSPRLHARYLLALGRARLRQNRSNEGIDLLGRANSEAAAVADRETRTIALLLLGFILAVTGDAESSSRRFDEIIALCIEGGDRYHLGAALNNRLISLDVELGRVDMARADAQTAIDIARELGNPQKERIAALNLAQLLYWEGSAGEALPLARRAYDLMLRFFGDRPVPNDALVLGLILLELHQIDEAASVTRWIEHQCNVVPPFDVGLAWLRLGLRAHENHPSSFRDEVTVLLSRARDALEVEDFCALVRFWSRLGAIAMTNVEVPPHRCIRRNTV